MTPLYMPHHTIIKCHTIGNHHSLFVHALAIFFPEQKEMTRELNSLPVSCDTLRIKQTKIELENKLREIENALKIFSRPKVFVKIDT